MRKKISFFIVCFCCFLSVKSQVVLQPITSSVYDFLDEMAQMKYIELNSAVKPYTRMFIAHKLQKIKTNSEKLNKRQQKELAFYFQDFNKELKSKDSFKKRKDVFFYKDSLFTLTVNPILGYTYATNKNGNHYHRWNGGEFYGYIGKHFGFMASLRDNGVSNIINSSNFLTLDQGANIKFNQGVTGKRSDYSEMKGAIYYSWKWGRLGFVKNDFTWGDNYHGANILSAKPPSFGYIDFKIQPVKWLTLNYTHSWLISEVLDSSRTYLINNQARKIFMNKNLAANLITVKPYKNLFISLGNSIVYSDNNIKPYYLIPFMFYKSVDHTYNGAGSNDLGQNAQMFMNISSRQIKYTHLYFAMFVDEISIGKVFDAAKSSNIFSTKIGVKVSNFPIKNTYFIAEFTRNNPWVYRHQIASTTFESNNYNLGNYLGENAQEIYLAAGLKIIRGLKASISYTKAIKGPEHVYQVIRGNANIKGLPFMQYIDWQNQSITGLVRYEIINDGFIFFQVTMSDIKGNTTYTPDFYLGKQTTISGGINFGF